MVSQAYKDLIADGPWARDAAGNRETPADLGINRADGYDVAYEQIGSGKEPERTGFNQREYELTSALIDFAATGVPAWDVEVDYTPASDAACFVTTAAGLWLTDTATGPATGNATDPDAQNQAIWRRY